MASDPSVTPISLEDIRTAIEGLSSSSNKSQLESLRDRVQALITDLQGKAVAIARRIDELVSNVIPSTRQSSFKTIKDNSRGRRETLTNLQTSILRLKELVETADRTRAELTAQIAALTERLNSLPNVDTEKGQLDILKQIFKFQWAELAVANKLLTDINAKNKPSLYTEDFQKLVQDYLEIVGANTGSVYDGVGIPTSAGDDRLATYKTANKEKLGVADRDLDYNWTERVDLEPSPEDLTEWETDVPSSSRPLASSAAEAALGERKERLVAEATTLLGRITDPSSLNDSQRAALDSLRDITGRLSISSATYDNTGLDRLQSSIDRFKSAFGIGGGRRRRKSSKKLKRRN